MPKTMKTLTITKLGKREPTHDGPSLWIRPYVTTTLKGKRATNYLARHGLDKPPTWDLESIKLPKDVTSLKFSHDRGGWILKQILPSLSTLNGGPTLELAIQGAFHDPFVSHIQRNLVESGEFYKSDFKYIPSGKYKDGHKYPVHVHKKKPVSFEPFIKLTKKKNFERNPTGVV
jgi:hypothetical protein